MTAKTAVKAARIRQGVVLSDKMDKTIVIEVVRRYRHRKYPKTVKERIRYKAHDENNDCKIGDLVIVEETRPLSKDKRWRVREIVQRAS